MSSASASIFEPKISNNGQLHFELALLDSSGRPIAGHDVRVTLEGDGSLIPQRSIKEIVRETNAEGTARFTWYRRGIYGRDVKATLEVSTELEAALTLVQLDKDQIETGPRTGWTPSRRA